MTTKRKDLIKGLISLRDIMMYNISIYIFQYTKGNVMSVMLVLKALLFFIFAVVNNLQCTDDILHIICDSVPN